MSKPETIMIDNEKYVKESSVKQKIVKVGAENSVASAMAGKFVLVRSRNEGINAGTIECADETGIILTECRRLYYHRPADSGLSWYEGVAQTGLSDSSKVSGTVNRKVIIEDYSITECSNVAKTSIMEKIPNEQN